MKAFQSTRGKLRKLKCKKLFEMAMNQGKTRCTLSGYCPLCFKYEGYTFCLSEVLGKGCEVQKMEKLEKEICESDEGFDFSLSLFAFNGHQKCPSETSCPEK